MTDDKKSAITEFDWAIYVDATLAGISILIPVPLVDVFFEWFFKRRMPAAIAKRNGRTFSRTTRSYLNAEPFSLVGCLFWPVSLLLLLLKRIYRTILYFLTVKEASDKLSLYWHRAFLIDLMIRRGDLDNPESAKVAALAMHDILSKITTSPLHQLSLRVVHNMHHVLRTIWYWRRRGKADADLQQLRKEMEISWERFATYLDEVGKQYAHTYDRFMAANVAQTITIAPSVDSLAAKLDPFPDDDKPPPPKI
jgi:hypothetical protein